MRVKDPTLYNLSYERAGKRLELVGPDDKGPSQMKEASEWSDGHHPRRANPRAWLRPGGLHFQCSFPSGWDLKAGRGGAHAAAPEDSHQWLYTIIGLILIWDDAQTHHNKLTKDTRWQSTQGAILNAGWGIPCLHEPHAPTDVSKSLFPEAHLERN